MVRKRIAILIFAAMALALTACEVDGTPAAVSGDSSTGSDAVESGTLAGVSDDSSLGSDAVEPGTVAGVSDDSFPGGDAVDSGTVVVAVLDEDQETNFRFLISDEQNAIGDFANLWVEIEAIGLQSQDGSWQELVVDETSDKVDLVQLQGDNAQEILQAQIPAGSYSKVFIEVGEVTGTLLSVTSTTTSTVTSTIISIKLPSSKLRINKPFEVLEDSVTSFVYDITVIAAGNEKSGIKYILKPVIGESGADQSFNLVKGKPDGVGKGGGDGDGPSAKGKLDGVGKGGDDDGGDSAKGKPDGVGKSGGDDGHSAQGTTDDIDESDDVHVEVGDSELSLRLEGDPQPGALSILVVTDADGGPATDATVTVNGEPAGSTDANGQLGIRIPSDSEELEIVAILGQVGGELEVALQ